MNPLGTLVIGAGAAGLTAARFLRSQSVSVTVLEKSRGPGGRMATKRFGADRADLGAPCLRLDDGEVLAQWGEAMDGIIWQKAPALLDGKAVTTSEGMNAVGKRLATGLDITYSCQMVDLRYSSATWEAQDAGGSTYQAPNVIVTCPLPQAAGLLQKHHPTLAPEIASLSQQVQYQSLWTAVFRGRPSQHQDDYTILEHPVIASLYHQGAKGLSQGVYVLHTSSPFTKAHRDQSPADMGRLLEATLQELGWHVEALTPHRWLYARVDSPLTESFLKLDQVPGLILAGDFCLGSSVMQAARSGWQAAQEILRQI